MNTQPERVLNFLRTKGPIKQMQAIHDLGVTRLAAVIHELKKRGYPITTRMVEVYDRYGNATHVAEYRLLHTEVEGIAA